MTTGGFNAWDILSRNQCKSPSAMGVAGFQTRLLSDALTVAANNFFF